MISACVLFAGLVATVSTRSQAAEGVLLLAHGGSARWNDSVVAVAKTVDRSMPTEVAFGMASRASIQSAVDKLAARGVTRIVAVPLFVSSHSSVITSTEYLLGLRTEAPPDLKIFAKMNHSPAGATGASHSAHGGDLSAHGAAVDPTSPIGGGLPVRMTPALNRHPLVAQIVADRARSISANPAAEAVILVAHGPVPDEDNRRWLADMAVLADHIRESTPYAAVEYMTVRDDAGLALREAATRELRERVERQIAAGRKVLIVPHLMSFGGIEQGVRKRLEGLDYTMTSQALMPDDRIVQWVLASAR